MSKEMMHTILNARNIPMSDQIELMLREEQSDLLLLSATFELAGTSFVFYDYEDGEKVAIAELTRDNLLGLSFTLKSLDDEGLRLARVRFDPSLTDKPISFDVELGEEAISEQEEESRVFSILSLNIAACIPVESDPLSSNYSPLGLQAKSHAHVHGSLNRLTTRAPTWNSETRCYLSNFGSRIRVTANTNFILVPREQEDEEEGSRVIVRFGRVLRRSRKWVLDFRRDVDVLQVFAIACAALADKPLVSTW